MGQILRDKSAKYNYAETTNGINSKIQHRRDIDEEGFLKILDYWKNMKNIFYFIY